MYYVYSFTNQLIIKFIVNCYFILRDEDELNRHLEFTEFLLHIYLIYISLCHIYIYKLLFYCEKLYSSEIEFIVLKVFIKSTK